MEKDDRFQIGEVAKANKTSIDTIRYYEKLGLLDKPIRSEGGFRLYSKETIEKLRFVKKAQGFGLTLAEIKEIMAESRKGLQACCGHVEGILTRKLEEFEKKINELRKVRKGLESLLQSWIPLEEARKRRFAVCPQIEVERSNKKGGKKNVKKKD